MLKRIYTDKSGFFADLKKRDEFQNPLVLNTERIVSIYFEATDTKMTYDEGGSQVKTYIFPRVGLRLVEEFLSDKDISFN